VHGPGSNFRQYLETIALPRFFGKVLSDIREKAKMAGSWGVTGLSIESVNCSIGPLFRRVEVAIGNLRVIGSDSLIMEKPPDIDY